MILRRSVLFPLPLAPWITITLGEAESVFCELRDRSLAIVFLIGTVEEAGHVDM